jgi:hypothetical protein
VDGWGHIPDSIFCWGAVILRIVQADTSEATDEGSCTASYQPVLRTISRKKNFATHRFNRKCTVHPQLFHNRPESKVLGSLLTVTSRDTTLETSCTAEG